MARLHPFMKPLQKEKSSTAGKLFEKKLVGAISGKILCCTVKDFIQRIVSDRVEEVTANQK